MISIVFLHLNCGVQMVMRVMPVEPRCFWCPQCKTTITIADAIKQLENTIKDWKLLA